MKSIRSQSAGILPSRTFVAFKQKDTMCKFRMTFLLLCILASAGMASAQKMKIGDPTLNDGKVAWEPMQIETGEIPYGVPITRTFKVTNKSVEDLVLLNVKTGCHCTVADWTKEPIPPGLSGSINITFDALREGDFYKVISVTTNFDPEKSLGLSMVGRVLPQGTNKH